SADLTETRAPDVVYFTVPVLGLVVYSARWVLPLSLLILVVAAATIVLARRKGARAAAMIGALGATVVAISLGYGAGTLLVEWARGAHLEAGLLPGALFYGEGWYVPALGGVAALIAPRTLPLARRWPPGGQVAGGAAPAPVLACVG